MPSENPVTKVTAVKGLRLYAYKQWRLIMSDKTYRWLILGTSVFLAIGLGIFLGKSSSSQKNESKEQKQAQFVLTPKATLPSEDARWTFAPDVPVPIGRRDQRRGNVHWAIREAPNEIPPRRAFRHPQRS